MWRSIKRLAVLLVFFLIGWYALDAGLVQQYLVPKLDAVFRVEEPGEKPAQHFSLVQELQHAPAEIDMALVRDTIFQLTNDLRQDQGAGPLVQNETLTQAADIRAVETEASFSHTRPNEEPFHTVLAEAYAYQMAGENLAMGTYHGTEAEMAAFLFDGWVESQGHYENMIEPGFTEIGIGVHYDGEMLYLVQIFGRPF